MNGRITVSAANGTPPYEFFLDGNTLGPGNNTSGLLMAGNYTVSVKDANGLTTSTPVTISDIPGPTIQNVDLRPATCAGDDGKITIIATGGTPPYTYSVDNINFQTGNVFTNLTPGLKICMVKDANDCAAGTLRGMFTNCPIIIATVTPATCGMADGMILITFGNTFGVAPYEYSLDGINFQTSNAFTDLVANNYIVTLKDILGTIYTVNANVTANCVSVTAAITNSTCGTANGTITATGSNGLLPYEFSIDGINFQTSNIFPNLIAGNYTLTIKDANGSISTTPAVINNSAGPTLNFQVTPASCLNNDGVITLNGTGGTAPLLFNLDGNAFTSNTVFANTASGPHTGMVKDANGCSGTTAVTVALIDNLTLQPILPVNFCEGKNKQLNIVTNGNSFKWTPLAGLDNDHIANPVASPAVSTTYSVQISLGVCSKSEQVIVNVDKAPVPNAGQNASVCPGQSAQLNGTGGQAYLWSPSTYLDNPQIATPTVIKPGSSVTYTLKVTDDKGCSSLVNSKVTVNVSPPPIVYAGKDTTVGLNQPFQLYAFDTNNSGFTNYVWSPPFGLSDYQVKNPVATLDQDIIYKVTAYTPNGCEGSDEIKVTVYKGSEIYVPSAFTPGNDGKNDLLKAVAVGLKKFNYFIVYNRWGNQVFYTADPSKGWDGTLNQNTEPTGVYIWIADGIDDKGNHIRRKGSVTLIR
jgi:gliding motility-associated-like protein